MWYVFVKDVASSWQKRFEQETNMVIYNIGRVGEACSTAMGQ